MRNKTKKLWWRNNPNVHEHLEFWVKNCSCADRLLWLEESNEFIRSLKNMKIIKRR